MYICIFTFVCLIAKKVLLRWGSRCWQFLWNLHNFLEPTIWAKGWFFLLPRESNQLLTIALEGKSLLSYTLSYQLLSVFSSRTSQFWCWLIVLSRNNILRTGLCPVKEWQRLRQTHQLAHLSHTNAQLCSFSDKVKLKFPLKSRSQYEFSWSLIKCANIWHKCGSRLRGNGKEYITINCQFAIICWLQVFAKR